MTYNEKKSLYESIMKDVAKTVKKKINEDDTSSSDDLNIQYWKGFCKSWNEFTQYVHKIEERQKRIGDMVEEYVQRIEERQKRISEMVEDIYERIIKLEKR